MLTPPTHSPSHTLGPLHSGKAFSFYGKSLACSVACALVALALPAWVLYGAEPSQWPSAGVVLAWLSLWAISTAGLTRWLIYSWQRDLQSINHMAESIAAGKHHTAPPHTGLAELGNLAKSLGDMAQQLVDRDRFIRRTAFKDQITGLDNRAYLLYTMQERLDLAREPLSLICWGIDNMDSVQEVMGHCFSDLMLQRASVKARRVLKHALILARLDGPVFCALIPKSLLLKELQHIDLKRLLQSEILIDGHWLDVECHAGMAHFPDHGDHPEQVLRRAEMARQCAKNAHLPLVEFEETLELRSIHRLALLSDLRKALLHNEFEVYLQPKMNMRTGEVTQAEALIRWQHPERGLVMPGAFIPLAEQTGFIKNISAWMLTQMYRLAPQFTQSNVRLSVNISAMDLGDVELLRALEILHLAYPDVAHQVTLEVTESSTMQDPEKACVLLQKMADLGFEIAIDDYGSGYSSLAYIKRFPVSELKIDRALVQGIEHDTDARVILQSTIEMGHVMGLLVTTEGVETESEYQVIHALGADFLQGYWLSKPMPVAEFCAQYLGPHKRQHLPLQVPASIQAHSTQPA